MRNLFYGLALLAIVAVAVLLDCKEAIAAVLCALIIAAGPAVGLQHSLRTDAGACAAGPIAGRFFPFDLGV